MSEFLRDSDHDFHERAYEVQLAERCLTPEEKAEILEEIAYLLFWLVEVGPGADPGLARQRRVALHNALALLGIDVRKLHWGFLYADLVFQVAREREFPAKPPRYPSLAEFSQLLEQLQDDERYSDLFEGVIARHGTLAEYLYGLGLVMSSALSYPYIFPQSDPIRVNRKTGEIEGRHRYLTRLVLTRLGCPVNRWSWVKVEYIE